MGGGSGTKGTAQQTVATRSANLCLFPVSLFLSVTRLCVSVCLCVCVYRVLRTVYLPSEKTDSMLLTIDALQRELDEYSLLSLSFSLRPPY